MDRLEELTRKRDRGELNAEETAELERLLRDRGATPPDPTVVADGAEPEVPGPGDSEGARPEP